MKENDAHHIIVMGVSGTGKTSIAHALRDQLAWEFIEGDDLHPESNIRKMSAGIPLDDTDREPWLAKIASWIQSADSRKSNTLITCSALKRTYRNVLQQAAPGVVFLHLTGNKELIAERLNHRTGHFMPPSLLESQVSTLEPLGEDETGVTVDVSGTLEHVVQAALDALMPLIHKTHPQSFTGSHPPAPLP